jgi:hypothetical protein
MESLDIQMQHWSSRLRDDLNILPKDSQYLASIISKEVKNLPESSKNQIIESSPVPIETRLEELIAFQRWMDFAGTHKNNPVIVRAQVITQNYICFVYLKETWFEVLRKHLLEESTTNKCCNFLLSNPIRFFRNAVSHGNWQYKDDFSGIEYWDRKDKSSPYTHWMVNKQDLSFWQSLSRVTAYASFLAFVEHP